MRTLDPALWKRVNAALDGAYAAAPGELPALLERLRAQDPDARDEAAP